MSFSVILYLISCAILWVCIAVNIRQLRRNTNLSKEYLSAIQAARAAEKHFLEAAETYHTMCRELQEDENDG